MDRDKEAELNDEPTVVWDDEDEATLAAIDQGIREADAGLGVPLEEVRKRLPKWPSSSPLRRAR